MERDSPLKQWARKISPSKSRNKPLPPAPKQTTNDPLESPTRAAPRTASTKIQTQEQGSTVSGQRKSSISKMRNLFSSSSKDHVRRSPPPQRPVTKEPYQRSKTPDILSSNSRSAVSKDHMRRHSALSPGSLTSRILALESELATTKKELARVHGPDPDTHGRRHPQDRGVDYDKEVEARYRRLVGQGHLDGLMETLMSSPERRQLENRMAHGSRNDYMESFAEEDAVLYQPNQQQSHRSSFKSRAVSAPHAVPDYESRESILAAQQSRTEAELKELRTRMRQAAWEQVQSQARAQLHRQAHLRSTSATSESERPPSRGKERSVSAPQDQFAEYDAAPAKPALRRVQGPLKKELPALPDAGRHTGRDARPARSSIRAVSAPMEETDATLPDDYQPQADFIFPPPAHTQERPSSEASSEDPGFIDRDGGKARRSHRRRPSERDITFLHENKRPRTETHDKSHKTTSHNQHGPARGRSDAGPPLESCGSDEQGAGHQSHRKAPLGESTASNVPPNPPGQRKVVEATASEEENTIDLDALSTPTKTRTLKPDDDDDDDENVYTYNDESANEDEESVEFGPPDTRPPSPERRHLPRPTRLETVREDFEWDDDIF